MLRMEKILVVFMVEKRFWIWYEKKICAYSDRCFSASAVNATVRGVRGNVSGGEKMYPGEGSFFVTNLSLITKSVPVV